MRFLIFDFTIHKITKSIQIKIFKFKNKYEINFFIHPGQAFELYFAKKIKYKVLICICFNREIMRIFLYH